MTKKIAAMKWLVLSLAIMLGLTSCASLNDTSYPGTMNVVEASTVVSEYLTNPNVIVIDARSSENYMKGHVKNAINISPTELISDVPVPMSLPSKEQLEKVLGEKGVSNNHTLYVYDNNGGVSAGRLWWTLKVYGHENVMIVNGGETALVQAGAELTLEVQDLQVATYQARERNEDMIIDFETLEKIVEDKPAHVKILDVRSVAEFEEGYIPGALLYPHTRNLYKDGAFMSSRDLKLFYNDFGLDLEDTIIVYCKTSFRATQTVALLEEAGFKNLIIYDGAWDEWQSLVDFVPEVESPAPVGGSDGS